MALRTVLVVLATALASDAFAVSETFRGELLPYGDLRTIRIIVDLDAGAPTRLVGRVQTFAPLAGEGAIISGQKKGSNCSFESELGFGVVLAMEGTCLPTGLEGKYEVRYAEGARIQGFFRLQRIEAIMLDQRPDAAKKPQQTRDEAPLRRDTRSCAGANVRCVAACPRDNPDAEMLCVSRCRRNLVVCKNAAPR